jgi:hypothetical protein
VLRVSCANAQTLANNIINTTPQSDTIEGELAETERMNLIAAPV